MDREARYWKDKWEDAQKQLEALQKVIESLIRKLGKRKK
jgi:hypothetical protein